MMTYYEELGVPAEASREQIRQAYKRLVRLLHPDQCGDPATRVLAELQMRRLNGILEVLSHPGERANYDLSLAEEPPDFSRIRSRVLRKRYVRECLKQPAMLRLAWAAGGVSGVLLFCALMPSSQPVPKPVAQATASPRQIPMPSARRAPRVPLPPATAAEREDPPTKAFAGYLPPALEPPLEAPSPVHPDHPSKRVPAAGAGELPAVEAPSVLAGDWLFVPTAETPNSGYPPEYIELRVSENQGVIRGRYRARYRVTDRAISPNVAFQFEGHTAADGGVLPWRGPGGAQGEVRLRLLANGNLAVEWEAGELGADLGLISGTATLVRKLK